ncbi:MAG: HD domain-containing protein [Deltaproteobacteria bacterium]|jgi:HD-GYP domain-containing protein (c-di-GMP phosphodiesterase class II)|nr:HD domain-containing protein [Deltaproteobacteria bacterium]
MAQAAAAAKAPAKKVSPGERLLHSMFRLLQVVKIHQANNKLFADNVKSFRDILMELWRDGFGANFSMYRGRFYLNDERIVYSPTMWATSAKMTEYFQTRGLSGLKFLPASELSDDAIVGFMDVFNRATRDTNPTAWLRAKLQESYPWVEIAEEDDKGVAVEGSSEAVEDSGLGRKAIVRGVAAKNLSYVARQTYSQTLTSLRSLIERLNAGKSAGIQKSKRAVQELIDLLFEDEAVFLALSTIRDRDDQLYTHSVNVTILVLGMGRRLGLSRSSLEQLGLCGLFHDLGKANNEATMSGEKLSGSDKDKIQSHSLLSVFNIIRLNASHSLKHFILGPAGEHHMGMDRSGYPKMDNSEEPLSLYGRVLSVADQYNALTSARPWRPQPFSPHDALAKLLDNAGTKLDPVILKVFVNLMGAWPPGSVLVLDTQEVAMSRYTPSDSVLPLARLLVANSEGTFLGGPLIDLAETDPATGNIKRNVLSSIHPSDLNLQPVEFLLDAH